MAGSRFVQSALSVATLLRASASATAGDRSATRSLTRQVRHHAAVTLTKTGRPAARSSARRAVLNASQPSARVVGCAEDPPPVTGPSTRSEEHTSELQSLTNL